MKINNALPVFYQNLEVIKKNRIRKPNINFVPIEFYQTIHFSPDIFYKCISKIWNVDKM